MSKPRVWWVLAWEQYYPKAALENVYETFEDKSEAELCAETLRDPNKYNYYDYVEVVNVSNLLNIPEEQEDE
jgi:hypothetical protein